MTANAIVTIGLLVVVGLAALVGGGRSWHLGRDGRVRRSDGAVGALISALGWAIAAFLVFIALLGVVTGVASVLGHPL